MAAEPKEYGSFETPGGASHLQGNESQRHHLPADDRASLSSDELPEKDAQAGLQQVEAITAVWSKRSLVLAYVLYAS